MLLSLGNGAQKVFAIIVSFNSDGAATADVGLSSALGGAFFVFSAVVDVISIFCSSRRPLSWSTVSALSETCFFLFVLFFLLRILYIGEVHILVSMGFVLLYIIYVTVIYMSQCYKEGQGELGAPLLEAVAVNQPSVEVEKRKRVVKSSPLLD